MLGAHKCLELYIPMSIGSSWPALESLDTPARTGHFPSGFLFEGIIKGCGVVAGKLFAFDKYSF